MTDKTIFDRLSATLQRDEREHLLATIRNSMEDDLMPVSEAEEELPAEIPAQMKALGLWGRILLFIYRIFSGKSSEEIITRWTLSTVRSQVQKKAGAGIDVSKRVFTDEFAQQLDTLRERINAAVGMLESAGTRRAELVLRLAAAEVPMINRDLLEHTTEEYLEQHAEQSERALRTALTEHLERRLADIPSQSSTRIRIALAQMDRLVRLSQFPFSTMIGSFSGSRESGDRRCAFDYLAHSLERLVADLASMTDPLERSALEALLLLVHDREQYESNDAYQNDLRRGYDNMVGVVSALREFFRRYPLVSVVRLIREDPWWKPESVGGNGNDWLAIYRNKLEERITRQVLRVSLHRQIGEQERQLAEIVDGKTIGPAGMPDGTDGIHVTRYHTAVCVNTFSTRYLPATMNTLRLILTGAEFYKSSNRAQFNDAFNEYERIPAAIARLEDLIRPEGDWGVVLHHGEALEERWKIASRLDEELEQLGEQTRITLETMTNLLGGILYARPGSPYDTIANYGQIGGRRNAELIEEIKTVHSSLQRVGAILLDVATVEKRARENGMYLRPVSGYALRS